MGDPRLNLQQILAIDASIEALSALDLSALHDVGMDEDVVWRMLDDAIKPTAGAAAGVMIDAVHEMAEAYGEGRIGDAVALQQQAVAKMEQRLRKESTAASVVRSAGRFGDGSAYRPAMEGPGASAAGGASTRFPPMWTAGEFVAAMTRSLDASVQGMGDPARAVWGLVVEGLEQWMSDLSVDGPAPRQSGRSGASTEGFPVMDAADFNRGLGEGSFEFIGFVRMEDGRVVPEALFRRNLAGIFVSTRGMENGMAGLFSYEELTPDTLDEYEMGIKVDVATQKAQGIVVKYESVYTEAEAMEQWPEDRDETGEPERSAFIIIRLDSITGPETHDRVRALHNFVADLLEAGAEVIRVERMLRGYQEGISDEERLRPLDLGVLSEDPSFEALRPVIRRHFPGVDLEESPVAPAAVAAAPRVRGLIGGIVVVDGASAEEAAVPSAAAPGAMPAADAGAAIIAGAAMTSSAQIMPLAPLAGTAAKPVR